MLLQGLVKAAIPFQAVLDDLSSAAQSLKSEIQSAARLLGSSAECNAFAVDLQLADLTALISNGILAYELTINVEWQCFRDQKLYGRYYTLLDVYEGGIVTHPTNYTASIARVQDQSTYLDGSVAWTFADTTTVTLDLDTGANTFRQKLSEANENLNVRITIIKSCSRTLPILASAIHPNLSPNLNTNLNLEP